MSVSVRVRVRVIMAEVSVIMAGVRAAEPLMPALLSLVPAAQGVR